MPRPAIFFDRDNTLIVSDGYLGDPTQVKLIDGAADAIARARTLGYTIVTFSNQSGVARGMFSEADVRAVNARMDELLRSQNENAIIDRHEFCPFHPEATVEAYRQDSDRRKPGCGMITSAARDLDLDLANSWVIGDAPRDIEAGVNAGCRTILFRDATLPRSPAAEETLRVKPDHTVDSLAQAIDVIEGDDDEHTPFVQKISPPAQAPQQPKSDTSKLEQLAEQILYELRRSKEVPHVDFSVPKLVAGISQVISIAMVFMAYLNRNETTTFGALMLFAIWVQAFTIALLIMGRQT